LLRSIEQSVVIFHPVYWTFSEVDRRDGQVLRHDSSSKTTLEGQIQGKKGCGRPRTVFMDWLLKTEEATIGHEDLKRLAQNR